MMKPVDLLIVKGIVIKLRVIVSLHKASARKIVDHGRDAGNGHGKVIGPGLDRGRDAGLLRVCLGQIRKLR